MKHLKVVAVGDVGVGKTSLLLSHLYRNFPESYHATSYDHYRTEVPVDGTNMMLHCWDTGGADHYDRVRPVTLHGAECLLLCFAVNNADSLSNIRTKWAVLIAHFCPDVPVLLVGCKADIREKRKEKEKEKGSEKKDVKIKVSERKEKKSKAAGGTGGAKRTIVATEDAMRLCGEMRYAQYRECSAKTQNGLKDIFDHAIRLALQTKANRSCFSQAVCRP